MILVAGATGNLGSEIVRRLRKKGEEVRGLVRASSSPEKLAKLEEAGATTAVGNLRDRASLDAACKGADTVISTVTIIATAQAGDSFADTDEGGTISLIDAAKGAGVRHFIFISFNADGLPDTPLTSAKQRVEQHLKSSGMSYTILKPAYFMESWLGPHLFGDASTGDVKIYGAGNGRIPYVSLGDVAEVAVRAVSAASARNAVITFGGPKGVTQKEVVKKFEDAFGKPLNVTEVPEQALESQWTAAEDPFQKTFSGLMLGLARLDQDAVPLRDELEFEMTSVDDFAKRKAAG
jgi:NADH dehydrogenase